MQKNLQQRFIQEKGAKKTAVIILIKKRERLFHPEMALIQVHEMYTFAVHKCTTYKIKEMHNNNTTARNNLQ
ncbi:hypothetical protein V8J88_10350 [Massilia sp. W12]|uniref:hypothetical protein n=1 Tax=Massilia sp. W12 TaxID=3126507 RepID=UPI0030D208DD